MLETNVLIIGGGVAGKTAAIYTARAGLDPIVLTGLNMPGGALMNTTDIENFPGWVDGVPGAELMDKMQAQAERFGAKFEMDAASSISGDMNSGFTVQTELGEEFHAKSVILALGSLYRQLGLESERAYQGHGVSYCATCDGFFFKGKELVVVGGGDTAMEDAIFLTKFAPKVTIIHRREELRASKIMQERAKSNPKIDFQYNKTVKEICGDGKAIDHVALSDTVTGEESDYPCGGVFVAIGADPTTELVKDLVKCDERGFIELQGRSSRTSVAGVFAAGDATDSKYQQAVVAAGAGAKAGIDCTDFLEELSC